MTGNRNYAKFAARQALHSSFTKFSDETLPNKNMKLIPHVMGGAWSTYPGLLEAAMAADSDLAPQDYDERELNYYPLAQRAEDNENLSESVKYAPLNISSICNWSAETDSERVVAKRDVNTDINKAPLVFDFGPEGKVAPGALPVTHEAYYPFTNHVKRGFSALPFGCYAQFNDVLFGLLPYTMNGGRNMLSIAPGKSYEVEVNLNAKKLFFLTGASDADDPFHEGAGAKIEIRYTDHDVYTFELVNMQHYQQQTFHRLYFPRKYFAGRLNVYNIAVVGLDTGGKEIATVRISDTGKGANLKIFAVTAELARPEQRELIFNQELNIKSNDRITYQKKLADGLYTVGVTCDMPNPPGATLDVYVQGQLVVNHVVPVAKTTYEIPVQVTDGVLQLQLFPGELHHKARSVIGGIILRRITITRLESPGVIPLAKKNAAENDTIIYGWKLRGQRAILRDLETTDYRGEEVGNDEDEMLLNLDASYVDKYGVGRAEFITDLPNGRYQIELRLCGSRAAPALSNVVLNLEGKEEQLVLPKFKSAGFRSLVPVHKIVQQEVQVNDRALNIIFALPPPNERNIWDECGIVSLKISKFY